MVMRSRALLPVAAVAVVGLLVVGYFLTRKADDNVLRASGTIEATEVDISFQIAGRVTEVLADEGHKVMAGDVLARLSAQELTEKVHQIQASLEAIGSQVIQQQATLELNRQTVEGKIAQARSQADAARAATSRVREGSRPQEIKVAEAELKQAEAQLEQRRSDFQRISELTEQGILPAQQRDTAETALRTAESAYAAANQRLALAKEGARTQDIEEAEARFEAAQAGVNLAETSRKEVDIQRAALNTLHARERELQSQLEAARTQLGYTEIHSPISGVVLTKNVESGEFVSPGTPVLTIANIEDLWMNVYIPETQTGLIKVGQPVEIRVDSFPDRTFNGRISFVSSESEFTPKTILTQEERIKLVYRAKVSLENTDQQLKPGMPADAEIRLQ